MRTVLCWTMLAAVCGSVATTIDAQVYQSSGSDSPRLLADGSDSFGASRKMLGSTFYTGTGSTSSSSKPESMAPPFTGLPADSNQRATPSTSPAEGGAQTIFPSATTTAANNSFPADSSKSNSSAADGNDSTIGNGLKSLQQRLTSVRKGPTVGAQAPGLRAPVVEAPPIRSFQPPTATAAAAAGPVVGISAPVVTGTAAAGPKEGPSPPGMPDIRTAQLPKTAAVAPQADISGTGGVISLNANDAPLAASTPIGANGPVVAGPVSSTRRAAIPAPASAPSSTVADVAPRRVVPTSSPATTDGISLAKQSPLMGIETSGPRSITIGREAAYNITVTNAGEVAAQDVSVAVKIPEWTEVLTTKVTSGMANSVSDQRTEPLVWRLPRLEARSKEQLTIRLIPHESKSFDLPVQLTCSPVASQTLVEVKEPKLTIALDGPSEVIYGETKIYRLTLANPGTGDLENVILFLAPVDGGTAPPTRHPIGALRAGESKPIEVELTARQAGTLSVKAVAMADGQMRAEVAEDILVRRAGLKAVITGPELKFAGTPSSYAIVVSNPGNAPAENVAVAAILPAGAKYVSSAGGQYVESENKVTWNLPTLRPGTEQEVEFRCALTAPGANRVQVLAAAASDLSDNMSTTTNVEALADLKLEVIDPPGPLAVGEELTYEVHIRNRGTKAAENVDVAGFFSDGVEPVSAQGGQHEIAPGQIRFRPIATIAAGGEVVLKIKARAEQSGTHVFRAEVNCPSMGAKLASEETTMFYGDGHGRTRTAARPNPTPTVQVAPTPGSNSAPTPATIR